jgi:hypothetical protein
VMKLRPIWTPADGRALQEAAATHPAYIHLQQRAAELQQHAADGEHLADVIDINTRRRHT